MRAQLVPVLASLALLAACETPGTAPSTSSTGGGAAGGAGSGTGAPTTPVSTTALGAAQQIGQIGDTVYFDYDAFALSAQAQGIVNQQASVLVGAPAVPVVIEGHTDERGTRDYNLALGDRRANAVRDYMVSLGVSPTRIRVISYGEERPAAPGSNEGAWSRNRRAVTVIPGARTGS